MSTLETATTPLIGAWSIDPDHTNVEFRVRHALTNMRGRFNSFEGSVVIEDDPSRSTVEVTIDPSSVDTGNEDRDDHLRSGDFFATDDHPTWTFRSTSVVDRGDGRFDLVGDLTIRGTTKPVTLAGEVLGVLSADPWGNARASFTATGEIDREDFGVSWNAIVDGAVPFVGKKVTIELEVELVKQ